ncbi:MAG: PAS domain S-box protein [Proteobacteria bacterium]|nr:PAS domain S-box protein [Pseudomonadota bacterium]
MSSLHFLVGRSNFRGSVVRGWLIVALLLGISHVHADPREEPIKDPIGRLPFQAFGVEQGLGNLAITQITQTSDGMIWLGTEDGLYRYDGVKFRHYGIADGLPSDEIRTLLPGAHELWVGTARGLATIARDQIHAFAEPAVTVRAMAFAPDGSVWAATEAGLLHQQADRFELAAGWPGGPSSAVWIRDDGRVIASQGSDVVVTDAHNTWSVRGVAQGFGHERIDAVARTSDGVIWIRSTRYLWACDAELRTCHDRSADVASSSEYGRLLVDHAGALWVPTHLGLAHRLPTDTWEVLTPAEGLPTAAALNVFEDREGSLWLGADTVYQLLGRGLWRTYTAREQLRAETVWAILRDADGGLWIGGNRGLVEASPDPAAPWRVVEGTAQAAVMAIVEGEPGVLYVGTDASEILRVDRATHAVRVIATPMDLAGDGVNALVYDHGTLWVAQNNGGLGRLVDVAGTPAWKHEPLVGETVGEDVTSLRLDRLGRLWAAGSAGLALRDGDHWRRFTRKDGLALDAVSYLVERASGEVCVGYSESAGVTCFRYDGTLAHVHHLRQGTALTSDKVYALGEDRAGRLYVGEGVGVDVIDAAGIEHFSTSSGLAGDDCAANAFWADLDGDVWIGSTRGVSRFAGARYRGPPAPPNPVLVSLSLAGELVSPVDVPTRPGPTSFTVSFATPTFIDRTQLEQQVRLVPLDDRWRTTTLGEARYAQLPPDDYVFEVRARIGTGDFGPVARAAFTVTPAWWQAAWFRVLLVVLTLGAIAIAIAWRARVIASRAARRIVARSEASFRALIEQSPDAVLVQREGRLIYVNRRTVEYLAYDTAEELIGCALLTLIHPDEQHLVQRIFDLASSGDASIAHEFRMLRRDGGTLTVEVSALSVDFGGTPAVLAIARDCTARKTMGAVDPQRSHGVDRDARGRDRARGQQPARVHQGQPRAARRRAASRGPHRQPAARARRRPRGGQPGPQDRRRSQELLARHERTARRHRPPSRARARAADDRQPGPSPLQGRPRARRVAPRARRRVAGRPGVPQPVDQRGAGAAGGLDPDQRDPDHHAHRCARPRGDRDP